MFDMLIGIIISPDFQDDLQIVDNFLHMPLDQWSQLTKYCCFTRSLSTPSVNKRVLFVILLQKLDSMETLLNLLSTNPTAASQNGKLILLQFLGLNLIHLNRSSLFHTHK